MAYEPETATKVGLRQKLTFRQRYDEAELLGAQLIRRLSVIKKPLQTDFAYKTAVKLTNDLFRKSSVRQRHATLKAAAWLIDILERR